MYLRQRILQVQYVENDNVVWFWLAVLWLVFICHLGFPLTYGEGLQGLWLFIYLLPRILKVSVLELEPWVG